MERRVCKIRQPDSERLCARRGFSRIFISHSRGISTTPSAHTNLSRHVSILHKERKDVQDALALSATECKQIFAQFKKEGILKYIKCVVGESIPNFQEEIKCFKESLLVKCGQCRSCYNSRFIGRHKKVEGRLRLSILQSIFVFLGTPKLQEPAENTITINVQLRSACYTHLPKKVRNS